MDAIAKVQTAEMSTRVISKAFTGFNRIFKGEISEEIKTKLNSFQKKMELSLDIIKLKRHIAESITNINSYPF